jgi:hypothetical protein
VVEIRRIQPQPITLGPHFAPASFAGTGDTMVGIQVADLSPYSGYQDVDLYVPFLAQYAPSTGAAWSANQTFALFGWPPLAPGENVLRLGIFASAF